MDGTALLLAVMARGRGSYQKVGMGARTARRWHFLWALPGLLSCASEPRGLGTPLDERALPDPSAVSEPRCYWQTDGVCTDDDPRRLRAFEPPADLPVAGVVLYVHGGAWNGDVDEAEGGAGLHPAARFMLAQAARSDVKAEAEGDFVRGYRVLSMDYTTATVDADGKPVGAFPAAVHDVKAAIRFARRYYADPEGLPLVVIGHSAGAHLTVLATASDNNGQLEPDYPAQLQHDERGRPLSGRVDGVVSLAGPLDLSTWFVQTDFANLDTVLGVAGLSDEVAEFFRCRVDGTRYTELPECYSVDSGEFAPVVQRASPLTYLDAGDAPLYVGCASEDQWVVAAAACPAMALAALERDGLVLWTDLVEFGFDADPLSQGLKSHAMGGIDGTMVTQFFELVEGRTDH